MRAPMMSEVNAKATPMTTTIAVIQTGGGSAAPRVPKYSAAPMNAPGM